MNIEELKDNVELAIQLRNQIEVLEKPRHYSTVLKNYVSWSYDRIMAADYGERDKFFMPYHVATMKLSELLKLDNLKFYSAFNTNKTKLISILNRYIKDMQLGFQQYDLELKSTN